MMCSNYTHLVNMKCKEYRGRCQRFNALVDHADCKAKDSLNQRTCFDERIGKPKHR